MYLLTYFRAVGLYSHCVHGTPSQCIGSKKASGLGDKAPEAGILSNKYKIEYLLCSYSQPITPYYIYILYYNYVEDQLLQDEVINILPLVQNVNAMAVEMHKPVMFSMMLVSPEARGLDHGRTEVGHVLPFLRATAYML